MENREEWIKEKAVEISSNAISGYRLIQRYGKILPRLIKKMKGEFGEGAGFPLNNVEILEFPSKRDFVNIARGIFQIQVFYKLNVTEVRDDFRIQFLFH